MAGLPFFDDTTPPPPRQPRLTLEIGGGAEASGFGGLADAAASLLGGPQAPGWAEHLVSLSLYRGLAPEVDQVELLVADAGSAPTAEIGDAANLGAGGDSSGDLFTGEVVGIETRTDGLRRYSLGNGSARLARTRLNRTLNAMSVADAVQFAAAELGLQVDADISGSDGVIEQIVLNDAAGLWDHLARLAALRGGDLWFDAAGVLHLADRLEQGDSVATFTWGQDLLGALLQQRAPHSGAVTVFGGGRNSDGFVLSKRGPANRAEQGEGAPQRFYRDGRLKNPDDLAGRAAAAGLGGHRQTSAGELLVSGSALLEPGAVVEVAGLPGSGNGLYLIRSVHHRFDSARGWRSRLQVSEAGDASGSGLPGALGGLL